MTFGAIAHAVLNAEVDTNADKQNRETHRYGVQRADQQQADGGSDRKPDEHVDKHRENEPRQNAAPSIE